MTRLVLDPQAFWLSLLDSPEESVWGQLGQDWRQGRVVLCLSPGLMAQYMGPIQGPAAEVLGLDEAVLAKIGWLLRQRAEWYQPPPERGSGSERRDRLAWLAAAARPDALVVADPSLLAWTPPLAVPVLAEPPKRP